MHIHDINSHPGGNWRWKVNRHLWNRRGRLGDVAILLRANVADTWMASPFCSTSLPSGFFCNFLTIGFFSLRFFFFTIIILTLHLSTTYLQSILYCFPKLLIYLSFQRFSILSWTFLIIYSVTFCQAFYQFWFLFKYFFVSSVSLKAMSSLVVSQLYAFRARSTHGDSSCVLVSD